MSFSLTVRCPVTIEKGDSALGTSSSDTDSGKHVPHTVFDVPVPTVVDELRADTYHQLFQLVQLIPGKEDTAHNFARGNHTIDMEIADLVLDRTRKLARPTESA